MREYRTPLSKRRRDSARLVARYWNDPDFRLRNINADRARRGRPLIASLDEVARNWSRKRVERED
jgi:hypothetical protein